MPRCTALRVQPLKRQEHDAEFRGVRRCEILVADVLRLAPERQNELLRAGVDLLARAALIGIAQRAVGVARELGVDRQPDRAAVLRRKAHGELDNIAAAGHGRDVFRVLLGREDVGQDRAELDLAHDTAVFRRLSAPF